jgi:hypothetical protein
MQAESDKVALAEAKQKAERERQQLQSERQKMAKVKVAVAGDARQQWTKNERHAEATRQAKALQEQQKTQAERKRAEAEIERLRKIAEQQRLENEQLRRQQEQREHNASADKLASARQSAEAQMLGAQREREKLEAERLAMQQERQRIESEQQRLREEREQLKQLREQAQREQKDQKHASREHSQGGSKPSVATKTLSTSDGKDKGDLVGATNSGFGGEHVAKHAAKQRQERSVLDASDRALQTKSDAQQRFVRVSSEPNSTAGFNDSYDEPVLQQRVEPTPVEAIRYQRTSQGGRVSITIPGGARYSILRRDRRAVVVTLYDATIFDLFILHGIDLRRESEPVTFVSPEVEGSMRTQVNVVIEHRPGARVHIGAKGNSLQVHFENG